MEAEKRVKQLRDISIQIVTIGKIGKEWDGAVEVSSAVSDQLISGQIVFPCKTL